MKRYLDYLWPIIGLVAVIWSVELLWDKLKAEAGTDAAIEALLANAGLWESIKIIATRIGQKIAVIPAEAFLYAGLATLVAYAALAWYDRIALIHLGKEKGISWFYISLCSFVTYALSHNIGASVFSGGMVRYRAYTAKGLTAGRGRSAGGALLLHLRLRHHPADGARPGRRAADPAPARRGCRNGSPSATRTARLIGFGMLAFVALYTIGAWLKFKPLKIGKFEVIYPRLPIVARQYLAAPLELMGAAGIIYFALPDQGNPGFLIVLGAFLLSFSAGLLSQVPGGVGVMEAVFLAVMPGVPAPAVFAALLIWRLFYLILPLVISLPIVLAFEREPAQAQHPHRAAALTTHDGLTELENGFSGQHHRAREHGLAPERDRRRPEHQQRAERLRPAERLAQRRDADRDRDRRADEGVEPGMEGAPVAQEPHIDGEAHQRAADDEEGHATARPATAPAPADRRARPARPRARRPSARCRRSGSASRRASASASRPAIRRDSTAPTQ